MSVSLTATAEASMRRHRVRTNIWEPDKIETYSASIEVQDGQVIGAVIGTTRGYGNWLRLENEKETRLIHEVLTDALAQLPEAKAATT